MKRAMIFAALLIAAAAPGWAASKQLPDLESGKVILLWTDFEKMLDKYLAEEPQDAPPPPADYSLHDAFFEIDIKKDFAEIKAIYGLEVLADGWVSVHLGRNSSGINRVMVDGEQGLLKEDSGRIMLLLKGPGPRKVMVRHTVAAPQKPGGNSFSVPLFPVPGAEFKLTAPAELSDIAISRAVIIDRKEKDKETVVEAVSGTIGEIRVDYSVPAPEAAGEEKEEVPPKVYSETETLLTIADEVTTAEVDISYDVKHNPVTGFEIEIGGGYEVIDVTGKGVAGWQVKDGVLEVNAGYEVKGSYGLSLDLESQRNTASGMVSLPQIKTRGVERETGHIAVLTSASLELKVEKIEDLMPLDVTEIPGTLQNKAGYPLLYAFRYVRHPYGADITVKRHQEVEVLNAAIDIINLVTIFTNDGKSVTRIIYELRNNKKQYVKIDLPQKAEVWSAYLDDEPVKPTRNEKGQVLLPLKKSGAEKRAGFTVELIYYAPVEDMEEDGAHRMVLPKADIPASEMLLSLYLPPHYEYEDFEGDLEKIEKMDAPQQDRTKDEKVEDKEAFHIKSDIGISSKRAINRQAQMEKEIVEQVRQQAVKPAPSSPMTGTVRQRPRGMLPVKFNVPLRGKPFRFSKLIIMNESPGLSFKYEKIEEDGDFVYILIGIAAAAVVFVVVLVLIGRAMKKKK